MVDVYTDGATNEKLGLSGAGVYMKATRLFSEYTFPLAYMSNHEAEFIAVVKALEICAEKFPNEILSFHTDAQIVVDAIEKRYVKNKLYKPHLEIILEISTEFPLFFIKWIPNKQNFNADRLAKKAINMQQQ